MADLIDSEPKQVVTKLYDAFGKGDMETIRNVLADDIEWIVAGDPDKLPWAGTLHGADAVIKATSRLTGSTEDLEIITKWTVSAEDKVISLITETATVVETGRFYKVVSVHIYTVKDGKIVRFENHFDPLPVLEATYGDLIYDSSPKEKTYKAIEEKWYFFEGEEYHHSEIFSYEYDEGGRRITGELNNPARGVSYIMSYKYDENGKGVGEEWVNPADDRDIYTVTYKYDEDGSRVIGGKGVGQNAWEFSYEYDEKGRKVRMTNEYSNGNSWVFTYIYDEDGKCVLGQGTATTGLRCTITYEYEDA